MTGRRDPRPGFTERWWIYQQERFPIFGHGILIAAFSFCAVSLSRMLRGVVGLPPWPAIVVAFISCFAFFLQLRIADEFKDFAEDSRYRPYRPVPRGLVSLRELAVLFILASGVQLALAIWLDTRLIVLLGITWLYLAAMSKEFFIADWLREHHLLYMISHMVIMPLVDLYATGSDWVAAARDGNPWPPAGLLLFLLASYFNGIVIELGRKIRSPQDEEDGVATYSRVWGRQRAVIGWWSAMGITMALACLVARRLGMLGPVSGILGTAMALAAVLGVMFLAWPTAGRGRWIEKYSGLWTIVLYLALGAMPRLLGHY